MTIGPWILAKRGKILKENDILHETIHWEQEKETLIIGFYLWYILEFLIRWIISGFKWKKSYRAISFEQEAYEGEKNPKYLTIRKHYNWIKYLC